MFDFVRTHQRLMQFLLLLLIFPSFAFFGIQSYTHMQEGDDAIAKVGGASITKQEFDNAQRRQLDRMRQMFGGQVDPKMFDTPEMKQNVLDTLIAEKAVSAEIARKHLVPSSGEFSRVVLQIFPEFANPSMTAEQRNKRFSEAAAMQGLSSDGFKALIDSDILRQEVASAVQATAFAPKTVAGRLSDLNDQEREVQELSFKPADFTAQAKVTDDMLKAYYDKNGAQFEIPEQAKAEYVVLTLDAIASQISVSDADVEAYYKQNEKRYSTDEQRRASHILVAVKKDAPAAEKAAAKAKAEKLLAEVRKNPADFAKVAKANSQDPGSAERGGDLDFFGKGMMVKPFEDAAWKLKQGEISDVVESDFGYHIIQLTGIKPAEVKPLEQVKGEIAAEIKKQLAQKKFAEAAESFSNTVYEQADSLKPAADKLKLKIETATALTRQPNPALGTAPVNNEKFLKSLFSDDSIKNKRNTEAVEVAPNTLIAGRIVEYKPATRRPFEEVKDVVRQRVTQDEAAKLAKKAGEDKVAALKAKDDAAGFGAAKTVSRVKPGDVNGPALAAVMKADTSKLPAYVGVDLGSRGYSVYRISKVSQPATSDANRRQTEQQQIANVLAQQEMLSYVEVLKQKAKTKILKPISTVTTELNAPESK
jgi:peptidyl-prolyl cis-trans isomerase D